MDASEISRFWSLVDRRKPNECWPWTIGCNSGGYGTFNTKDRKTFNSHRLAAILTFGPDPEGRNVLHDCDNPKCCNPDHLRFGTQRDNVKDAIERGRHVMPPIYNGPINATRGADVWNATLTEIKVHEIWRLHLAGKNTAEIASATKSPRNAVVDVCRGRTWRHLKGAPSTGRLAKGGVRRGKLTPENIKTAKRLIKDGLSNKEIGAILGTSPTPISYLRNYGTTWRPKP